MLRYHVLNLQGTHPCLQGNTKAMATVTAIIDGTGSMGEELHVTTLLYLEVFSIFCVKT